MHVINFWDSYFSKVEVCINIQQVYESNELYTLKSYLSENFKGAIFEYRGNLRSERFDYEETLDESLDTPLSLLFLKGEFKCSLNPKGFKLLLE